MRSPADYLYKTQKNKYVPSDVYWIYVNIVFDSNEGYKKLAIGIFGEEDNIRILCHLEIEEEGYWDIFDTPNQVYEFVEPYHLIEINTIEKLF